MLVCVTTGYFCANNIEIWRDIMRTTMKGFFVALVLMIVTMTLAGCSDDESGLSGTFELSRLESRMRNNPDQEDLVHPAIEFTGNRFIATSLVNSSWRNGVFLGTYDAIFGSQLSVNLDGSPFYSMEILDARAGSRVYRSTLSGTYSITEEGDRIEFLFSNGEIRIFRFARTENTIDIDGRRLIRR